MFVWPSHFENFHTDIKSWSGDVKINDSEEKEREF